MADGKLIEIKLHRAQMEVFSTRKRFRVVCAGRRLGKCLDFNTLVAMSDGSYKRAGDIVPGDEVLTLNEESYRVEPRVVEVVADNGVKEIAQLTLMTGETLRVTPNHPILANNTWIEAGYLTEGDLVAVPKHLARGDDHPTKGDIAWVEVKSIEFAGEARTIDLQVEGNHNFIAGNIVTHNTKLSIAEIIRAAKKPKQKIWYVAPTYRMAHEIAWADLKVAFPSRWINKTHDTNMSIWLKNGTQIQCKGAENYDSLRGVGLNFVVLDEVQDIHPDAWYLVIRPTLASTNGSALFTGTPKSFNLLYDLYQLGQDPKMQAWASWQFPTIMSPFIPQSEIDDARKSMDIKSFQQEFESSFLSMSGRVYYAFDRRAHVGDYAFNPNLPIWVGIDFNINPMSTVVIQPQKSGEVWVVDEIVLQSASTMDVVDAIERKYWRYQAQTVIYPDATGNSRQHARAESDLDIFRERGYVNILHHPKNPPISDRVNAVNRMFRNARGDVRLRIDRKCSSLINSLDQTIYRPGSREVNKRLGTEHSCFHPDQKIMINGRQMAFRDVPESGHVMGHDGEWREYIAGGKTLDNVKMIELMLSDRTSIKCTPGHKFLTIDGWLEAKDLKGKVLCTPQLLAILSKSTQANGTICAAGDIFRGTAIDCIAKFGKIIMGRFQKIATFITKITTKQTIASKILSFFQKAITCRFMQLTLQRPFRIMPESAPRPGMVAKRVESGIVSNMKGLKMPFMKSVTSTFVNVAEKFFTPIDLRRYAFVQKTVKQKADVTVGSMTRRELAHFVEKSLSSTNILQRKRALGHALTVSDILPIDSSDAFCVCVPDIGMFEIGGVITSNSDALGYCIEFEYPMRTRFNTMGISI